MTIAVQATASGFIPARGFHNNMVRLYPVSNSASEAIGLNDAVYLDNGVVKPAVGFASSTDLPSKPLVGVVIGLRNSNNRPLTFNQPTGGPSLGPSTTGFAEVLADPFMTYEVLYSGTIAASNVGENVAVRNTGAAGPDANTGISTMQVQALAGADAVTAPFKIVNLADTVLTGGAGTNVLVEVIINNHLFKPGSLGV
ncbi:hypothetical protein EBZ39_07880 [bacterium]|nr:hypothetical protein [bacterium]